MKIRTYIVNVEPFEDYRITFKRLTDSVELENHIAYIRRLYEDQLTRRDLFDEINRFSEIKTIKGINKVNFENQITNMVNALR